MATPKYAFFDLDGTLYPYEAAHVPAQSELIQFLSSNLKLDSSKVTNELLIARQQIKDRLGSVAASHSRMLYISEFLIRQGFSSKPSFVLSAEQVYWKTFLINMKLYDGVEDFLSLLRLRKVNTFLVTDLTTAIQYRKIGWLGLDNYFDVIVTSEQSGGDKVTGLPEAYIAGLIENDEPLGWSIGDKDWDHLFSASTEFFKRDSSLKHSLNGEILFQDYRQLIDRLLNAD
jgi:FMN phosphatase YigB (HAD superfamily)